MADTAVAAVVGSRINPSKLSQNQTYPALRVKIAERTWNTNLDGPDGTADARVEFELESTLASDVEAGLLAVRNVFDGLKQVSLSGVQILFSEALDDADDYDPPEDASDRGTYVDTLSIMFRYQISKPVR